MRNVSPAGRSSGAGIAARWTTASAPATTSWHWPEVGQVGHGCTGRAALPSWLEVDVEDVVAVLAQVAHDPSAGLAAAARDDDPHVASSGSTDSVRSAIRSSPRAGSAV